MPLFCPLTGLATESAARVLAFSHEVEEIAFPVGEAVDIDIPLPAQHTRQRVLIQSLRFFLPGEIGQEAGRSW